MKNMVNAPPVPESPRKTPWRKIMREECNVAWAGAFSRGLNAHAAADMLRCIADRIEHAAAHEADRGIRSAPMSKRFTDEEPV